jgi:hypothetical protein
MEDMCRQNNGTKNLYALCGLGLGLFWFSWDLPLGTWNYPPMCTIVRDGGTKSGSPIW